MRVRRSEEGKWTHFEVAEMRAASVSSSSEVKVQSSPASYAQSYTREHFAFYIYMYVLYIYCIYIVYIIFIYIVVKSREGHAFIVRELQSDFLVCQIEAPIHLSKRRQLHLGLLLEYVWGSEFVRQDHRAGLRLTWFASSSNFGFPLMVKRRTCRTLASENSPSLGNRRSKQKNRTTEWPLCPKDRSK